MSGTYTVRTGAGTLVCKPRGKFRLDGVTPLVGDRVLLNGATVWELLPRLNVFARPPVANVELIALLASRAIPVTDPYVLDLMIANAEHKGCAIVVIVTKIDLEPADELYEVYTRAGFDVVCVSAVTGTGLAELRLAIDGKLTVFAGDSGVGKSSVLNALSELNLAVGSVSRKLGRGRHTTRHTELFELPALDSGKPTYVIDTAGFSKFQVDGLTPDEVADAFRELERFSGQCRFADCKHVHEPGCAVTDAVERGEIPRSRHASYSRMLEAAQFRQSHKYD
jgi:ribosome biogenesis GTPase